MDISIVKVPLRIPIAGGGTDIPEFTKYQDGYCISAAINKFIYVIIKKDILSDRYHLKYSKSENVSNIDSISHPIIKTVLKRYRVKSGIEIITFMDVPHSSGLGSSSSFTVALITCINKLYLKNKFTKKKIAEEAIIIERKILKEYGGIQDQIIASYSGIKQIYCKKNYQFNVNGLNLTNFAVRKLEEKLSLFFTNKLRSSSKIQQKISYNFKKEKFNYLLAIKEIAYKSRKYLLNGDFDKYGDSLDKHWNSKKKLSSSISFPKLDQFYKEALNIGCLGGKMIGAGGGGFIIIYSSNIYIKKKLIKCSGKYNFKHTPFRFIDYQ